MVSGECRIVQQPLVLYYSPPAIRYSPFAPWCKDARPTMDDIARYLWIMLGGALGTGFRFWCSAVVARAFGETFPWGTLMINVLGSLVIGFFATITGPDGRIFA